jgi:HSP20 family protein
MSLMRGNDWRILRGEMDRLFDDFFANWGNGRSAARTEGQRFWAPAVDVAESQDQFIVRAELPGLKPEDIDIELQNNVLTLKGERKLERKDEQENYHFVERSYGSFFRSFTLPRNVNAGGVQASFEHGVLTISIPKAEEAKPRKVAINGAQAEPQEIAAKGKTRNGQGSAAEAQQVMQAGASH